VGKQTKVFYSTPKG